MKNKTTYYGEVWKVTKEPHKTFVDIGIGWETQRVTEKDLEEMLKAIREAKEETNE